MLDGLQCERPAYILESVPRLRIRCKEEALSNLSRKSLYTCVGRAGWIGQQRQLVLNPYAIPPVWLVPTMLPRQPSWLEVSLEPLYLVLALAALPSSSLGWPKGRERRRHTHQLVLHHALRALSRPSCEILRSSLMSSGCTSTFTEYLFFLKKVRLWFKLETHVNLVELVNNFSEISKMSKPYSNQMQTNCKLEKQTEPLCLNQDHTYVSSRHSDRSIAASGSMFFFRAAVWSPWRPACQWLIVRMDSDIVQTKFKPASNCEQTCIS